MYLPLEYYITYLLPYWRFSFSFCFWFLFFWSPCSTLGTYLPTYLMLLLDEEVLEIC